MTTPTSLEKNAKRPWASTVFPDHVLYFISGGIAGAASRTIVSPLERLKIIMQCQGPDKAYRGVFHGLVKMWKEEGFRGYMRGNGVNVLRIAPYSAVQFTAYEQFKKIATKNGTIELDTPRRLCCGALAGIASVVSTYPLDLVRSRLAIATATMGKDGTALIGQEVGIWGMTVKVFKEEGGVRALYRGMGVAPYVGLNFAIYEQLRQFVLPADGQPSVVRKLCCGALAYVFSTRWRSRTSTDFFYSGAISQTLTYPLDVLRRKMQVTGMSSIEFKYDSAWHAAQHIVKTEGLKGLYRGIWPNLLKVAPAIGTSFATYEAAKTFLGAS